MYNQYHDQNNYYPPDDDPSDDDGSENGFHGDRMPRRRIRDQSQNQNQNLPILERRVGQDRMYTVDKLARSICPIKSSAPHDITAFIKAVDIAHNQILSRDEDEYFTRE